MESMAVDLQLIRSLIVGDARLFEGRTLAARVASMQPGGGRGTLSLAGALLDAELPSGLHVGQEIRLQVREVTPDKVWLQLQERPPVLDQPVSTPMPGGGTLEVRERSEHGGGGDDAPDTHTLTLVYDAPSLGAVQMRFVLTPGTLALEVSLNPGEPYDSARESAQELREALSQALARTIVVSVVPRREPVEIYA